MKTVARIITRLQCEEADARFEYFKQHHDENDD